MSELKKIGFGAVNDTDKDLESKGAGGVFGLNTGRITTFEVITDAGKDKSPGIAVDITFTVSEKEFRRRMYNVTKIFDKDGNVITDETTEEYITKYNDAVKHTMAVIVHTAKSLGVTQDALDKALSVQIDSYEAWANIVIGLLPTNFKELPVDGFLQWQWQITGENDKTYLELPKNMKGGRFFAPHVPGKFVPQTSWTTEKDGKQEEHTGLRYVDGNNVHPFIKKSDFMESNKANQQFEGQVNVAQNALDAAAGSATTPAKSTW